jgi:site-specific DNA-methyltransferase (adenine-specific)
MDMGAAALRAPLSAAYDHLPEHWSAAPRRWGHALHSTCSYLAMFPPTMPHYFIRWLTAPGDVVWDPFSGRGTTAFEACLLGRRGLAADANPLAWLLTSAKVDPPALSSIQRRLRDLERLGRRRAVDAPDHIRMLFSDATLRQLVQVRDELSSARKVDRFLLATLAGGLHANANKQGEPRGLTVAMPNTFAMAPGYVRKYIEEHDLQPPEHDVVAFLRERLKRYGPPALLTRGEAWQADAQRAAPLELYADPPKLIFFSPPYLQVISYGKFNWIRLWLLGEDPRETDLGLFRSSSLTKYLTFMHNVLGRARDVLRPDGYCCVVVGDVRRKDTHIDLAAAIAGHVANVQGLRLVASVADELPVKTKVSRIWGEGQGRATKTDRILIFAGPDADEPPPPIAVNWVVDEGIKK